MYFYTDTGLEKNKLIFVLYFNAIYIRGVFYFTP